MPVEADAFNPVIVDFYQTVGYLPEAIINYLALLGWSLDDKSEHFSRQELIEKFSLERVNKAPASFDPKKLLAFEDWHFQQLSLGAERSRLTTPFLEKAGLVQSPPTRRAAADDREGHRRRGRPDQGGRRHSAVRRFLPDDDELEYDEQAVEKHLRQGGGSELLAKFRDRLAAAEPFDAATLEALMHNFVAAEQIKIGQIIHAVRVAVTGKSVGLGLFDTLAILGRERSLRRIENAIKLARPKGDIPVVLSSHDIMGAWAIYSHRRFDHDHCHYRGGPGEPAFPYLPAQAG